MASLNIAHPSATMSHGFHNFDVNNQRDVEKNRFHDHYGNEYASMENSHVNEVGSAYNGLNQDLSDRPKYWLVEDQAIAGGELQKWNDSSVEKIHNIRDSSGASRDLLLQDSGVASQFYKMSSDSIRSRHELENAKRSLESLRAMKERLLK